MKEVPLAVLVAAIYILLSSCMGPIYKRTSKELLQNEELNFLKPGETTLAEIKEHHLLRKPLAIRNNGKLLLYKKKWSYWRELPASLYGYDDRKLDIDEFLFIEIDENNKLKHYDVLPFGRGILLPFSAETKECTSWGLCLDMDPVLLGCIDSLEDDASYIFLAPQVNQAELEYPHNGQCQIFIYSKKGDGRGFRIQIDENPQRAISKKSFFRNIVSPGNHRIAVSWPLGFNKTDKRYKESFQQKVSCKSGESLFVNVSGKKAGIGFRPPKLNINIETAEEGLKVIRERRLIID